LAAGRGQVISLVVGSYII